MLRKNSRTGRSGNEQSKAELDYAWAWFHHSASQRLITFNFFLVIVGLLLVAYAQTVEHEWRLFGLCLGLVGMIVSIGFLAIDFRNEMFVKRSIGALRQMERGTRIKLAPPEEEKGWVSLFKYRVWFRLVIVIIGLAFAGGLLWAALGFPAAGHDTPTCRSSTVLVLHRPGVDLSLVRRSEHEGEQGGADDYRGGPGDGLSGYLHVQSVGMGDHQRVKARRHCGEEPVGGG